jgi:plastocyanin
MRQAAWGAVILGFLAAVACGGAGDAPPPPTPGAIPPGQSIGSGVISGRTLFSGTPPPRRPIRMSGEAACHRPDNPALSEELVVNGDGSLRNAWVHVVEGLGDRIFAPPTAPAEIDQIGCLFVPHVLAVEPNQVIILRNSDPAVHNVRAIAQSNPTFNVAMSARGKTVRKYFPKPEIVKIRCDIHAWMSATIVVGGRFQAVTGEDGSFALQGLPAGTYVVEAWHETLGAQRQTVTIGEGETGRADFTFAAR